MVHWFHVEPLGFEDREEFGVHVNRTGAEWAAIAVDREEERAVERRRQLDELRLLGDVAG